MKFTLGLAQTKHPVEGASVEGIVSFWAKRAKEAGVDLLVFPESLMSIYEKERQEFIREAQRIDGAFSSSMQDIARKTGLWMVYTMNEFNPEGKPFNTAVVLDDEGQQRGFYRKVHLFDTDFTQESDRMSAGNSLFEPIDTDFCKLGLGICYDLRFPELCRQAALKDAQVMLYPAAWVSGNLKAEQWKTLLCARAIENGIFVAGLSRVDKGYIGQSCIVDPQGVVIAAGGTREELVCTCIDTSLIEEVRARMPLLKHRRSDLY